MGTGAPTVPAAKGQPVKAGKKGAAPKAIVRVKAAFFRWVDNTKLDKNGNPVFEDLGKTQHIVDLDTEKLRLQQRQKFAEDRPIQLIFRELAKNKIEGKSVDVAVVTGKMVKSTALFEFEKIESQVAKSRYTVDTTFDILGPDGAVIKAGIPITLPPRDGDGCWEIILGAKDGNIEWAGDFVRAAKPYPPLRYKDFLGDKFKPYGTLTPACNGPGSGSGPAEFLWGRGGFRVDSFTVHCMSGFYTHPEEPDKWYDVDVNHRIFTDITHYSAHYIIDRAGVVYEEVEPQHFAKHVGVGLWNNFAIGAELLGLFDTVREKGAQKRADYEKDVQRLSKDRDELRIKLENEKAAAKRKELEQKIAAKQAAIDARRTWMSRYDDLRDHHRLEHYTDAQYESLAKLAACLAERYEFQFLEGHDEIQAGKTDPGTNFDWPRAEKAFPGAIRKR